MQSKSNEYYQNYREEMISYLPPDAINFLEIGCGEGNFGANVKKLYTESVYWGMELDEISAGKAKSKIDNVLVGNCENIVNELPENYFDCVIFNDSLEHLQDPFSLLESIKSKMKKGGHIVSSIPNFRYHHNLKKIFFKKDFEYLDSGILDRTHLRFFTKKSISRLFEDRGYEIEILEGINGSQKWKVKLLVSVLPWLFDDVPFEQFACRAILKIS